MKHSLGRIKRTSRGFELIEFRDRYDNPCSLQVSSIADYMQPGIFIGVDDPQPQVLNREAHLVGMKPESDVGWMPYPIPPEVHLFTRAHLDRKQVALLIRHLQAWLKNGSFKI